MRLRLRREQRERERQEEERTRWEEEEHRRKEDEKIKHLEKLVGNWNQSGIGEFLSEVEKAAAENPAKKTDNLSNWLFWPHAYADSFDPIRLTFLSASKPNRN